MQSSSFGASWLSAWEAGSVMPAASHALLPPPPSLKWAKPGPALERHWTARVWVMLERDLHPPEPELDLVEPVQELEPDLQLCQSVVLFLRFDRQKEPGPYQEKWGHGREVGLGLGRLVPVLDQPRELVHDQAAIPEAAMGRRWEREIAVPTKRAVCV